VTPFVQSTPRFVISIALGIVLTATTAHSGESYFPGTVTVSDGKAIPPGAVLKVRLLDLTPGIAKDASVAHAAFRADGKPPVRFDLPYLETSIDSRRLYGIAAVITDSRGRALWETRVPIRVLTMGNQKKVELVLWPATPLAVAPEPTSFALECGDTRFEVTLTDKEATISGPAASIVLARVETSVGRKYSDGSSNLSVIGEAVYMQLPTRAYRDCKMVLPR
jgi:uncharacterized lipoprotein YbaY